MRKRYLTTSDIIYWIEPGIGSPLPVISEGIYLASYNRNQNPRHIVTPSLGSLVVMHLEDKKLFKSRASAEKALQKLFRSQPISIEL